MNFPALLRGSTKTLGNTDSLSPSAGMIHSIFDSKKWIMLAENCFASADSTTFGSCPPNLIKKVTFSLSRTAPV